MCSVLVEPRLTLYVSRFVIHLVFLLSKYKVWSLYCYIRVCDLFISLPLANWCNYNFHVRLNCFRSATLTQPQLCSPVGFKSALVSSQIHVKGFGAYKNISSHVPSPGILHHGKISCGILHMGPSFLTSMFHVLSSF